jgi:threonylcarbamoyladenosine tRNA methylthiotransferase MtaB
VRRVYVKTFGCKVNYAESVEFSELLRQAGFEPAEAGGGSLKAAETGAGGPVVLVNSCCVTAKAERKVLQFVRRFRREHPDGELLFTGCGARHPEIGRRYQEAGARVFGFYNEALDWLRDNRPAEAEPPAEAEAPQHRTRAFLKVQDGCSCRCSYCIIPQVKPYYSRLPAEVLGEVDRRLAEGYRELVLAGVNLGHYGRAPWRSADDAAKPGERWNLDRLLAAVLARLPEGTRLRLSSVEPEDVTAELMALFADGRLCPHLHMPLQSGSDAILTAMRRQYTAGQYLDIAAEFRRRYPDGSITADIMVGFPGESEDDFAATLSVCEQVGFERVHCFPYSPRPGTPAADLPAMPRRESVQRNRRLIEHCHKIVDERWRRFIGQCVPVLIEERLESGAWRGHGDSYQVVNVADERAAKHVGEIVPVKLIGYAEREFTGEVA